MNIIKKTIQFSILLLLSCCLLAMDNKDNKNNNLIKPLCLDIRPLVFRYFDPRVPKTIIEFWDDKTDENFWKLCAQDYFGDYANKLKRPDETWEATISRWHGSANLLSTEAWTKEDVKWTVENYLMHEKIQLSNLERLYIEFYKPLIHDTSDLIAAIITIIHFNFWGGLQALDNSVSIVIEDIGIPTPENEISAGNPWGIPKGNVNDALLSAMEMSVGKEKYVLVDAFIYHASDYFDNLVEKATADVVEAIKMALRLHSFEGENNRLKAYWVLSNQFTLSHLSQGGVIDDNEIVFQLKKVLNISEYSPPTTEQILALWAKETWEKEELREDPYVRMLERIVKAIAPAP